MKKSDRIHILFVCGYGVGTSVIMENNVRKALKEKGIEADMQHAAGREVSGYKNWAQIIGISKKLVGVLEQFDTEAQIIEIVNLMDGKSIADNIEAIMKEHYPEYL